MKYLDKLATRDLFFFFSAVAIGYGVFFNEPLSTILGAIGWFVILCTT